MSIYHSKKTLLAFLTALSISLGATGCTNNTSNQKETRKEVSTEVDSFVANTPSPTLTSEESEKMEMEKLVSDYLNYFSSIEVKYPQEKFYPSKKEINKILSIEDTYQEYEHQDSITIKKLYKLIKKNSAEYVKKHPKYQNAFPNLKQTEKPDLLVSQINFKIALQLVLEELKENSTNDFLEDICKMKDLKIVFANLNKKPTDGTVYGIYDEKKNQITLDSKAIEKIKIKNKYNKETKRYKIVLKHELSHTTSTACKHRINKGQKFNRILDNCSTLVEASAESSSYALDKYGYSEVDHLDFTYSYEREEESLMLLLGLFHDNQNYVDYYNAINDANPEKFYEFCGVKTKKEKQNLHKILAAIDGRNGRNDIVYKVKKSDSMSKSAAQKIIRYNYRLDIFHKVLTNMIDYTCSHPNFTIEKNLQMLSIVENCILENTFYLNQKNSFDQNFIIDIYQSETKYLEFLSQYYFKGEKDSNSIKEDYKEDYIGFDIFENCIENIDYRNALLDEFPLLKPILFTHDCASFEHQDFLEENKKFIKEKCTTR